MNILVITDRLSKGAIFKPYNNIIVEVVVLMFIYIFYRYYGLLSIIVSNKGP
jgi:hypothetical protein